MEFQIHNIFWAFFGGVLPALLWLWFWLKEDFRHPEPARVIFFAFVGGALVVPIALVLEKIAFTFITGTTLLFIVWAAIEEILKFAAAYFVAFRKRCIDKSRCINDTMDPIMYLITAALGFAALENALFLLTPLGQGDVWGSIVTGNLRFIGAMVLHVVASASIGIAMGFSFYKKPSSKKIYTLIGIFTAIVLHALFNISIINSTGEGNLLIIFSTVWIGVFILLALFERIKKIKRESPPAY